jgi:hypothetical protein
VEYGVSNSYTDLVTALTAKLVTLTGYSGLTVLSQQFRPAALPAFGNYCIVVSPNARPWDEIRTGVRQIQYLHRVDLFLLVRRWDESGDSLYGTASGKLGLFQMVEDVKFLLRGTTLGELLDRTYDEPGGDLSKGGAGGVDFEELAAPGFEAGEYSFVHRVRIPYLARMQAFCHPA